MLAGGGEPRLVTYGISDDLAGHGRADVRRDRPHLHPRAHAGDAATRRCAGWRRSSTAGRAPWPRCSTARTRAAGCTSTRRRAPGASAGRSCSTSTSSARRAGWSPTGAPRCATSARTARRSGPACGSTSPRTPTRRGCSSSARSTSPPRWRRIATGMGYRVTIADPRRAFLASARFSASADTIAAWPDEVIEQIAPGPRDAVLVFTHDAKLDVPALMAAFGDRRRATSARSAAARRPRTASSGCARPAPTDADLDAAVRPGGPGHRRGDRGGDGDRRARRDHRPPRRAHRRPAARRPAAPSAASGPTDPSSPPRCAAARRAAGPAR